LKYKATTFGEVNKSPRLSIIVVAYKTGKELTDCLDSLENQIDKNFELIVVDNGSKKRQIIEKHNLKYYKLDRNYGPSYARNLGAKEAAGELLSFLDDDAVADKYWTQNIIKAFNNDEVVAIRGKVLLKSDPSIFNYIPGVYDLGDDTLDTALMVEGNCAIRRKNFLNIKGFNVNLYGHEGVELSYRLKEFGQQLYIPSVIIYHDSGDNLAHLVKRSIRHGYNTAFIADKYPAINTYSNQFSEQFNMHRDPKAKSGTFINIIMSITFDIGLIYYRIHPVNYN